MSEIKRVNLKHILEIHKLGYITMDDAIDQIYALFPVIEVEVVKSPSTKEFSLFSHWKEEGEDDHGGTIKHFQD